MACSLNFYNGAALWIGQAGCQKRTGSFPANCKNQGKQLELSQLREDQMPTISIFYGILIKM